MEAGGATNRALQLRAMDGLRKRLSEEKQGARALPSVASLADVDASELAEIGAGRLGAVAIVLPGTCPDLDSLTRLVQPSVRRTDLLVTQDNDTLVVLAPGLDPVGGQSLTARLERVLLDGLGETSSAGLPSLGTAYRSPLSLNGWDVAQLVQEARRRALSAPEPETAMAVA
jgi:hypothetical protein